MSAEGTIRHLILHSPYAEPTSHWEQDAASMAFEERPGRRPAGYVKFNTKAQSAGITVELKAVNEIRRRVKVWREAGYPNATRTTRQLLGHWARLENPRPFFCQLEAIETLIWLTEAPETERQGLAAYGLEGDGGPFRRVCTKLCTGGGKTAVMAMLIAWHVCNKAAQPQSRAYARDILIVAPNLTVRERLQGLNPAVADNEYERFGLVPEALAEALQRARVRILNWQAMQWEDEAKLARRKSVDKRGAMSDRAYARAVLGPELCHAPQLLVINDEAHHAWRLPAKDAADCGQSREEKAQATVWVSGLDRLQRAIGILACHDFSATPFVPSGRQGKDDFLFKWIVSDFGLNDGIESGLVKTPRMASNSDNLIDPQTYRSLLYDLYEADGVKTAIDKKSTATDPLPPLVLNAYALLAQDWKKTADAWRAAAPDQPLPVLISVVNSTTTAERIERAFLDAPPIFQDTPELCDAARVLRIDSEALEKASATGTGTAKAAAEALREKCNTVGKRGAPGEPVANVISVAMLSEGWDAKTVTHILGLRAFTSQLLCEQVIGRGLRRTHYDLDEATGLLEPQYVQVLGVPFRFLPVEGAGSDPKPPKPTFPIAVAPGRDAAEITWPNILRIDPVEVPELSLAGVPPLVLNPQMVSVAQMAQTLGAWFNPANTELMTIRNGNPRLQTIRFHVARALLREGNLAERFATFTEATLFGKLVHLVEAFLASDRCTWREDLFWKDKSPDDPEARWAYAFNIGAIAHHLLEHLTPEAKRGYAILVDPHHPTHSTARMRTWLTTKDRFATSPKSQIAHAVYDSTWEQGIAQALEADERVQAYVRNDRHVGLRVRYRFEGASHDYIPDFVIRLTNGLTVALEVKGQDSDAVRAKRAALEQWCAAVTQLKTYGPWRSALLRNPQAIHETLVPLAQALPEMTN